MIPEAWIVSEMQLTDLDTVAEIENQTQEVPWSKQMFADCLKLGYQGYVLRETDGNLVCFTFFSFAADECHLLNIATQIDYQRHGYAKALLDYCLAHYRDKGIKACYLEVRESNLVAQQLYERFGFQRVGLRKAYYVSLAGREDAWVMCKELHHH